MTNLDPKPRVEDRPVVGLVFGIASLLVAAMFFSAMRSGWDHIPTVVSVLGLAGGAVCVVLALANLVLYIRWHRRG